MESIAFPEVYTSCEITGGGYRIAANSCLSPLRTITRMPSSRSASCIACRIFERSRRKPPHVSDVPKRQFFVNGTELAIIFQWMCGGSGVARYVRSEENCWAPSMLWASGENGGLEDSLDEPYAIFSEVGVAVVNLGSGSVRYRRVSSMKNEAGPLENWKYVVLVSGPEGAPEGTGGLTET